MNKLRLSIQLMLVCLVLMSLSAFTTKADVPGDITDIGASASVMNNYLNIEFSWVMTENPDNIDGFRIYAAPGEEDDYNNFSLMLDISIEDVGMREILIDSSTSALLFGLVIGGELEENIDTSFTFYITAYNNDGESNPSGFVIINFYYYIDPTEYLEFTSVPEYFGYINTQYIYDADAVYPEDENADIVYSIIQGPEGMEIDEETGEITWTPEEAGYYWVWISAALADDPSVYGEQYFDINVYSCQTPATISGTVTDESGDPVNGYIYIITDNYRDSTNNMKYSWAQVVDGQYSFEADAGDYIMRVEGESFIAEWWQDKIDYEDADIITIECGQSYTYNLTVTSLEDLDYYTVTGNVSIEGGTPLAYASVELYTEDNKNFGGYYWTTTDENGNYSIEAPGGFSYIAVAYYSDYYNYMPLYYNQKTDPSEADVIELNGNVDNINFVFDEIPDYNITLSGTVVNPDTEAIAQCFVVAFMVNSDSTYREEMFNGVATMTDDNGAFSFTWLAPGDYVLLAFPPSTEYAPGFYKENDYAVWTWSEASVISLDYSNDVTDIVVKLPLMEDMFGMCNLDGTIRGNSGSIKGGGDVPLCSDEPIVGASCYLETMDGKIVKYGKSNSNGKFSMSNLAKGSYYLKIDKVGFENYKTIVTLTEDNATLTNDVLMAVSQATGVNDVELINDLFVSPNPASDYANISFNGFNGNVDLSVSNMTGVQLFNSAIQTTDGNNSYKLNTKSLSDGIYLLTLKQNNTIKYFKLVVVH